MEHCQSASVSWSFPNNFSLSYCRFWNKIIHFRYKHEEVKTNLLFLQRLSHTTQWKSYSKVQNLLNVFGDSHPSLNLEMGRICHINFWNEIIHLRYKYQEVTTNLHIKSLWENAMLHMDELNFIYIYKLQVRNLITVETNRESLSELRWMFLSTLVFVWRMV